MCAYYHIEALATPTLFPPTNTDSFISCLIILSVRACLLSPLAESTTLHVLTHVPKNLTVSFDKLVPRFYLDLTPNQTEFEECQVVSITTVDQMTANITCNLRGNLPSGLYPLAVFAEGFGLGMLSPLEILPNISSVSPREVSTCGDMYALDWLTS